MTIVASIHVAVACLLMAGPRAWLGWLYLLGALLLVADAVNIAWGFV